MAVAPRSTILPETPQQPPIAGSNGDPVGDADALLGQARAIEDQEMAEVAAIRDHPYNGALAEVIEEKQEQAGEIESRLENMVEQQSARLQQVQSQPPGMLALPNTKAKWYAQVAQVQASMQRLQNRLESVREIKEGIGIHGPKIEAVAAQKLAYREPELTDDFAELQEARRLHEANLREREKTQRKTIDVAGPVAEAARADGASHGRGLSQSRGIANP